MGEQAIEEGGGRLPVAHQAVRDDRRIELAERTQGTRDELLRDADAKATGEQLVPDEPLALVERVPGVEHGLVLGVFPHTSGAAADAPRPSKTVSRSVDSRGGGKSSAIVSAMSPTASYDSWKSQSGMAASAVAQARSLGMATTLRGLRPIKK